jgi:nucleotide-binding universal stress UspA family protein
MKLATIVIGVDFSEASERAVLWTARHFAPEAELVLVHALDVPEVPAFLRDDVARDDEPLDAARAGAADRLAELGRGIGHERTRAEVRNGPATEALQKSVRENGANVLVVGEHGVRGGFMEALGSTAERMLHTCTAPVLLARGMTEHPPRTLLVPLEEGGVTDVVLGWVAFLAKRFDARVELLHVLSSQLAGRVRLVSASGAARTLEEKLTVSTRQWLQRRAAQAGLDPQRTGEHVVIGEPRAEVIAAAARMTADLIIMGSRGSGTAGRLLLGSVAKSVLRGARRPVLVVSEHVAV